MLNPLALLNPRGLRGFLFGAILLSTLWVTSLTILSTRDNATALLTEAGTHVLNPFLVGRGLGLSQSGFADLKAQARAHPDQSVALSVLTVRVLGRDITGRSYADVVRLVYSRVAQGYYDGGASAVFSLPPELKQVLPAFAVFNGPTSLPALPGTSTPVQLPTFLQPFFTFVGLTPATFTADGHARLAGLLPWFWLATVVLGVIAVVLNRSEQKLAGLVKGVIHSTWPVVLVLIGLLVLSGIYTTTFAPYVGILGVVSRAFLPVYGTALAAGLLALGVMRFVPGRKAARPQPVPVGVPAGMPMSGFAMPPGFARGSDTTPPGSAWPSSERLGGAAMQPYSEQPGGAAAQPYSEQLSRFPSEYGSEGQPREMPYIPPSPGEEAPPYPLRNPPAGPPATPGSQG